MSDRSHLSQERKLKTNIAGQVYTIVILGITILSFRVKPLQRCRNVAGICLYKKQLVMVYNGDIIERLLLEFSAPARFKY